MLGGISICHRKRDPSACMIIHILFLQMSQLHSRSVLMCLVNLTLTTKSASHTSQFVRQCGGHILYCSRIRKNVTDRQTENRQTNYRGHSNPRWIAGLSGPIIIIVLSLVLYIPVNIIQRRLF